MASNHITKENQTPVSVWNKFPFWIRNVVIAAIVTLSIHLSLAFIVRGRFFTDFNITDATELPFTFFYFLALFWIYPLISKMVHSSYLSGIKKNYLKIIEGFSVVASTVLLSLIFKFLPLWLTILYINSIQDDINLGFSPDQVRRSFIIHAIIGLFFYYFVERQHIRKQLQQQQLEHAKLQKEKFRVELENLKAQVNPVFLFNSLNFLDKFIQENPAEAEEFVNRLSNVYRLFLNRQDELIPLQKEILQLDDYLYIINSRFKDSIIFKKDIEEKAAKYLLPPETLQTLIESFISGISLQANNSMMINIFTNGKHLFIGIGFYNRLNSQVLMNKAVKNISHRYKYFTEEKAEVIENASGIEVRLPLLNLGREN